MRFKETIINKKLLLLLASLFGYLVFQAQNPYFVNYALKDGLPSSNVYCVQQDENGYVWMGTDAGVARYDGYSFRVFTKKDGLSDNEVFQIKKGADDRLWFLTFNGKLSYFENDLFYKVKLNSKKSFYLSEMITGNEDEVFFGSSEGEVFHLKGNRQLHLWTISGRVLSMTYKENLLTCLTNSGVWRIDVLNDKLEQLDVFKKRNYDRGYLNDSLTIFSSKNKLFQIVGGKTTLLHELAEKSDIIDIGFTPLKQLYLGTRDGIYFFDKKDISKQIDYILKSKSVSKMLIDNENNLWVSTLNNGVYFSSSPESKIYSKEILPAGEAKISAIAKDQNDNLWLGASNNTYYHWSPDTIISFSFKGSHSDKISKIRIIEESVWIVGESSLLEHTPGHQIRDFYYRSNDFFIYEDRYWLAGFQTHLYALSKEEFERSLYFDKNEKANYAHTFDDKGYLKYELSRATMFEKNKNGFWIGSTNGLYAYANGNVEYYGDHALLFQKSISDILYSAKEDITYVATSDDGVYLVKNKAILKHFTRANSQLKSDITKSLCLAEDTAVWVGTLNGISKITGGKTMMNYNSLLGIEKTKINDIEVTSNILNLATDNGLLQIKIPASPFENSTLEFKIDSILINEINKDKITSFNLKYNENKISIFFTGLQYRNHASLSYDYKLEGYHERWFNTKSRKVSFEALPYGNYQFRIKASNLANNSDIETIQFSITPPFWERWWFVLMIALSLLAVAVFFWRRRIQSLRKRFLLQRQILEAKNEKIELEKSIIEIEHKAMRMQMNPHFIFNALNTIKGYYAENKTIEANDYIVQFSKLLRNILESSSKYISLAKELDIISSYLGLAKIRYKNAFDYEITLDKELLLNATLIPPMLVQPFVENAIIHGVSNIENGMILISFKKQGESLLCEIEDNGRGRDATKLNSNLAHKSISIDLTKKRLTLLQNQTKQEAELSIQDLFDASEKPSGTVVKIKIPLKYA